MNIKYAIKKRFMIKALKSSSRKHPFSVEAADSYILEDDAGANMTDSHYFSAHASDGTSFFFRHAKRSDQTTEIWFCLKTSDGKVLCNKQELYPSSSCPADVRCTISGEEMSFSFNGQAAYESAMATSSPSMVPSAQSSSSTHRKMTREQKKWTEIHFFVFCQYA